METLLWTALYFNRIFVHFVINLSPPSLLGGFDGDMIQLKTLLSTLGESEYDLIEENETSQFRLIIQTGKIKIR